MLLSRHPAGSRPHAIFRLEQHHGRPSLSQQSRPLSEAGTGQKSGAPVETGAGLLSRAPVAASWMVRSTRDVRAALVRP